MSEITPPNPDNIVDLDAYRAQKETPVSNSESAAAPDIIGAPLAENHNQLQEVGVENENIDENIEAAEQKMDALEQELEQSLESAMALQQASLVESEVLLKEKKKQRADLSELLASYDAEMEPIQLDLKQIKAAIRKINEAPLTLENNTTEKAKQRLNLLSNEDRLDSRLKRLARLRNSAHTALVVADGALDYQLSAVKKLKEGLNNQGITAGQEAAARTTDGWDPQRDADRRAPDSPMRGTTPGATPSTTESLSNAG